MVKTGVAFHVVKPSETLFSISRQYGISIDDLRRWNNLKSDALSPGMKLAVSNGMPAKVTVPPGGSSEDTSGRKMHIVKPSETLFAISRRYGVTVQQIKEWNHLSGNNLEIGQKLVVSAPGAMAKQEEKRGGSSSEKPVTVEKPGEESKTNTAEEQGKAGITTTAPDQQNTTVSETPAVSGQSEDDVKTYEPAEKTVERGLAEVIDDASDSRKYLALHRTAPIGTIMQIKNEMNDQIVFVRVVGRIPDTGDNSKILIKISKKAYDRLGALDKRFPVIISYVK
jgi:LysM repeat protein